MNTKSSKNVSLKRNLGCGKDIKPKDEGWINLDVAPLPGVDVVWDVKKIPWPFENNTFDLVFCSHFLEHIPHYIGAPEDGLVCVMREIHRILKKGGVVEIKVPYYAHKNAVIDPTHCRFFDVDTFDYFTSGNKYNYYSDLSFKLVCKSISAFTVKWPNFFRIGKSRLGIFDHLRIRYPRFVILKKPCEIRVVLQKEENP